MAAAYTIIALLSSIVICASAGPTPGLDYPQSSWDDELTTRGYGGRRIFQAGPSLESYSPPPPAEGGNPGDQATCSGVAYDGYISNCVINFESLLTSGAEVLSVDVLNGIFDTGRTVETIAAGYLVPAPANTSMVAIPRGQPIEYCYDIITRMPEILPMASLPPSDCENNIIVMDMASTLLQYGTEAKIESGGEPLDQAAVKSAFGFPSSIVIGQFDAIQASNSETPNERARGIATLKGIAFMRTWIGIMSQALSNNPSSFAEVAKEVVISLAQYVMDTREDRRQQALPSTRRRLFEAPEVILYLNSTTELQALARLVQERIEGVVDEVDLNDIDEDKLRAINQAIANMVNIASDSTSFREIQQALQVAATSLTTSVRQLVSGNIDAQQFEAATAPAVLRRDANAAFLEGVDDMLEEPTDGKGSTNQNDLIIGLVGGLGGGLILIGTALAFFFIYRKRHQEE